MEQPYKLHYAPDNASLVIRLALEELGQSYETVLVDRGKKAEKTPEYTKLNPMGLVPVLETKQGPIFETAAILLWLSDRHSGIAPDKNAPERGDFLKWLFFVSNTLHIALRQMFYPASYVGVNEEAQSALRQHSTKEIVRFFDMLEQNAGTQSSVIGGTDPNALDIYIAACMRWIALYPRDLDRSWFSIERWPHLQGMARRLEDRASVAVLCQAEGMAANPFTAPDYPNPLEGSAT
ncbi:MAG: glutathione S-transferase family protein [Pseudomonadota bacterium]